MQRLVMVGLCVLLTAVGIVVAGTSVHAFDLTGTWEGTYACKGSVNGEKDKYVDPMVANITQVGTAVGANVLLDGSPYKYNGIAVANAAKPDKGDAMFVLCNSDDDLNAGPFNAYDELGRFSVVTKSAKGTGTIKGTSVYSSPQTRVYTCRWKLKRTSTANPNVTIACP